MIIVLHGLKPTEIFLIDCNYSISLELLVYYCIFSLIIKTKTKRNIVVDKFNIKYRWILPRSNKDQEETQTHSRRGEEHLWWRNEKPVERHQRHRYYVRPRTTYKEINALEGNWRSGEVIRVASSEYTGKNII